MSTPKKKYDRAERLEIIKQSFEEGVRVTELAERFGISPNTIYNWRAAYYREQGIQPEGQGVKIQSEQERQITRLQKQLREARLERDILKKAIGIFSKTDGKFTRS